MASAYTLYPTAARRDQISDPRNIAHDSQYVQQIPPSTPGNGSLHPSYSTEFRSASGSPALNNEATPAESESTLSVHYQSSEFSESDDPFFGINFGSIDDGSPSFLGEPFAQVPKDDQLLSGQTSFDLPQGTAYFPLSPDKTPSLHTSSPNGEKRSGGRATFPSIQTDLDAQQDFVFTGPAASAFTVKQPNFQFTPDTSGSGRSSDDGLAPAALIMPAQSPQVTVSEWGKDEVVPYDLNADDHQHGPTGDVNTQYSAQGARSLPPSRDGSGRWVPNQATGQSGLDPNSRPTNEVPSMNEMEANRKVDEKNQEVDGWLDNHLNNGFDQNAERNAQRSADDDDNIPEREIALGSETENRHVPGQTYYVEKGGELTEADLELMRQGRNWADAPLPFAISKPETTHYQPETSQAAIEKFEELCRDNASVVSRAATWGTRRRSLPSISDFEGVTSGNFLKKLSLSRGEARRPSILKELRGLMVKKPNANNLNKRTRPETEAEASGTKTPVERKDTLNLSPPGRSLSWNKKQDVPSINTAFVAMGSNMASIGATHTRSGSISATPITSPRSPSNFSLSVKKPLNRIRSKSDLPKNPQSGLADMWRKSGGPPVAYLAKPPANAAEAEDDDDEDEDSYEDSENKDAANKLIEEITPNFGGFQQHVLKLNPMLDKTNNYLVDRIAHQQIIRYKSLLNARVKHLQNVSNRNCSAGAMCIAMGGSANALDSRGDARGLDPMSARYDGSDGDVTPLEGVISQESFPPDIPMPPTATLPAEFECQLCFQPKKFQKPSDWTKHVHEDVQPFTCTWDRCRDPKIFKRKADWVRHENEGHRHLEWWTCDVEDCRHICYRRDNFLQHLVREHKFAEPKIKTKAAIKRMGNNDPTWQKVDQCHEETQVEPQQEPCRFCGKVFPTWKKLTVHLAKHMEQISLPILKLVAKKELEADTIISPVQEPPQRQFPITYPIKQEQNPYGTSPMNQTPLSLGFSTSPQHQFPQSVMYPIVPPSYQPSLYTGYDALPQAMSAASLSTPINHYPSIDTQSHAYSGLQPVVTSVATGPGSFMVSAPSHTHGYMSNLSVSVPQQQTQDVVNGMEPFPSLSLNPLGLQDHQQGMHGYNHPHQQQQHLMDPHSANGNGMGGDQYVSQPGGSVSPYDRSPHQQQQQNGFYGQR
ncbi:transcription factor IIIA [Rhypophila decipiens]|uniref:Transcription factor IIIA n=1 Tax=Rhypophila decipiens TaxID=261697 RepID=A0AAN7BDN9_9PEZI|nr:transcription factor IIIA [Rhypophila decipiens]